MPVEPARHEHIANEGGVDIDEKMMRWGVCGSGGDGGGVDWNEESCQQYWGDVKGGAEVDGGAREKNYEEGQPDDEVLEE